jgi:hypothetical protein
VPKTVKVVGDSLATAAPRHLEAAAAQPGR